MSGGKMVQANCKGLGEGACCVLQRTSHRPQWLGWERDGRVMGFEVRVITRIPESVGSLGLILSAVETTEGF